MAKENKREQILRALEALLPGRRFHEITLEEVAREAQVGKGTIYLYFKDKDALFAEMAFFRLEKLCEELEKLSSPDPALLPDRAFALGVEFLRRHHSWFGAVSDLAGHVARLTAEQCEHSRILRNQVVEKLSEVLKRVLPEDSGHQATVAANLLLWMIQGFVQAEVAGQSHVPTTAELLDFFRRGTGIRN